MSAEREERSEAVAERLRALPRELPPPLAWATLRERMARRKPPIARPLVWLPAALAAALLLVALLLGRGTRAPSRPQGSVLAAGAAPQISVSPAERWLAELPEDRSRVRVGHVWAVTALEDRIASQDDALNAARLGHATGEELQQLQQERARLIHSLVLVRYAEDLADTP